MGRSDKTNIGGINEAFQTTSWSEICNAKTRDETRRRVAVGNLIRRYWKPVYCYLRHKGYTNEHTEDLTQGFFHEIVLGRQLIQQADKAKGRFRTFLLKALDNYVTSEYRKETAQKRWPTYGMIQLEATGLPELLAVQSGATPEQIFDYAYTADLVDQVLTTVEQECLSTGKATHWKVFYARVVLPILDNTDAPSLKRLCEKYQVKSKSTAANMIVTVKRRFRAVLRRCLRQSVQTDPEVEEEFNDLLNILSKKTAG